MGNLRSALRLGRSVNSAPLPQGWPMNLARGLLLCVFACAACRQETSTLPRRAPPAEAGAAPLAPDGTGSAAAAPQVLFTGTPATAPRPSAPAEPPPQPAPEPPRALNVAVVGDSLSDYRSGGGGYIRHLEKACPESHFENLGRGGAMTNQMRRHFEAHLAERSPAYTHVIVFGGVNDLYSDQTAGRTNDKISADLTGIYEAAHRAGARVVALTVTPWGGFKRYFTPARGEHTLSLNRWIQAQSGGLADAVLDVYPLLSCDGSAELCESFRAPFNDGLHFGPAAHELIGERLRELSFSDCL